MVNYPLGELQPVMAQSSELGNPLLSSLQSPPEVNDIQTLGNRKRQFVQVSGRSAGDLDGNLQGPGRAEEQ